MIWKSLKRAWIKLHGIDLECGDVEEIICRTILALGILVLLVCLIWGAVVWLWYSLTH